MAWARYDDELPMNKKVGSTLDEDGALAGAAAIGLHLLCNTWARHQGTAGFIPRGRPGLLLGDKKVGHRLALILERIGMFDPAEGGWRIHDFEDFSDPDDDGTSASEKKRRLSEVRAAAGRKGGLAKAGKQDGKPLASGWQCSSPDPDPDPDPPTSSCTDDDDDLQSAEPSSVVVDFTDAIYTTARLMANELASTARNVQDRNAWIAATTKGVIRERSEDITRLLREGMTAQQAAEFLTGTSRRDHLRVIDSPQVDELPLHGPWLPPPPAVSQDEHIERVRARAAAGDEQAKEELDVWEKRLARKAALGGSR